LYCFFATHLLPDECELSVLQVLEGKPQYIEFAGNLIPVMKSGDQLHLGFHAFRENRLPFTVRVKDQDEDTVGRILFMREPKVCC
jgi:ankyrin